MNKLSLILKKFSSVRLIVTGLIFFFLFSDFKGQVAPGIEWRKCTWSPRGLDSNFQKQTQSGEEWWYSHKNVYSATGTHTSYVTVGYTSLVSTTLTHQAAKRMFNEGADSPCNPIDDVNYDYTTLNEGCGDRDYLGEHRTPPRGNIGLNALDGSMMYCKPKTIGALEEVIQDPDDPASFYVVGVHVGVRPYRDKVNFIPYNRSTSGAVDYFSLSAMNVPATYQRMVDHIYIAKISLAGDVIWEGLYGYLDYQPSPIDAFEAEGYGYDIIKASNGHLIATGYAKTQNLKNSPTHPILLEIDPSNGNLLNKAVLPVAGPALTPITNSVTGFVKSGRGHSLAEIGTSGKYALVTTYFFGNSTYQDKNNTYLWCYDQTLQLNQQWTTNPIRLAGTGPINYGSNCWEVNFHKALNQILVPVVRDCGNCATAGGNFGNGFIYRFMPDGTLATNGVNPSPMGPVNAFDLRIGVCETNDGGFITVSSTRPPEADHSPPTQQELGYLANCPNIETYDWDTDAVIAKFDMNGNLKWKRIFDLDENRKRLPPPADLKRQECMYKITQAQDGGYTISGNSSGNFDDFYMAKLFNDCNAQQTYTTGPDNVINIISSTTWTSSMNVLGQVIVHPGAVLTVKGSETVIRFADSDLTGVKTNVTVKYGGKLKLEDGALFTSVDPSTCTGSKWDGVTHEDAHTGANCMNIFPNPAQDYFNLLYNGEKDERFTYSVSDMLGRIVAEGEMISDLSVQLNLHNFSAGIYSVSVFRDKKFLETKKLVVVRP